MRTIELSDVDGDALTLITDAHGTWITCTSGADEVTVGPFPARRLRAALTAQIRMSGQVSERFIGSDRPPPAADAPTADARQRAWDAFLSTVRTGTLREALDSALDAAHSAPETADGKGEQPAQEPGLHLLSPRGRR